MDKKKIESFIKKYSLNGLIEASRWNIQDKTLSANIITTDKKFLTKVTFNNIEMENAIIGVSDAAKLKKLIGVVGDDVSITYDRDEKDTDIIRSLIFSDSNSEISYQASLLDTIEKEPSLKSIPPYEVEIPLNEEFITLFQKAKSALPDSQLYTISMNKKKQKLELILGYSSRNNTDRISLNVPTVAGKDKVTAPISFSAKNLTEVLSANTEVKDAVLKISEAGLSSITFTTPDFQSEYYMIKIEVED